MSMLRIMTVVLALSLLACPGLYAAQSAITETEGYACMGADKSRKQTEQEAMTDAKRKAAENVRTHVKSQTTVKDLQIERDLIDAYAQASIRIVREMETGWYRDPSLGECYKTRIQAEVIPEERVMDRINREQDRPGSPALPLNVRVWSERKEYLQGDKVKIYLQGNKPFYARVLYKDAGGNTLQVLPNLHRRDHYFKAGVIYEIPAGDDHFDLEVSPPFGEESIVVYAGTAPLGDLALEEKGGVYQVRTRGTDIGITTRGMTIQERPSGGVSAAAEFVEAAQKLMTRAH